MPTVWKWVPPDLFLEHKGVKIYHAYKNDEYEDPFHYWFSTTAERDLESECDFDVRGLDWFDEEKVDRMDDQDAIKEAIRRGIDEGVIRQDVRPDISYTTI